MSETAANSGRQRKWWRWGLYLAIPLAVYFGNVQVQSYLGRQALDATGLTRHSLDEALAIAQRENKLVLADMSAIWCTTCRRLDREVLSHPSVKRAIERDYVFSRIEYESEEGKAFMARYEVDGFPTLLILDSLGNKLIHLPLTFSPDKFIQYLDRR